MTALCSLPRCRLRSKDPRVIDEVRHHLTSQSRNTQVERKITAAHCDRTSSTVAIAATVGPHRTPREQLLYFGKRVVKISVRSFSLFLCEEISSSGVGP